MGLRDLFSSKGGGGNEPVPSGDVVLESTYVKAEVAGGIVHATVQTEKVTERESRVMQEELVQVAADSGHKLAVDMSPVMMLASAGIGALVQVHRACEGGGGKLVIHSIDGPILEMLKIPNLGRWIAVIRR